MLQTTRRRVSSLRSRGLNNDDDRRNDRRPVSFQPAFSRSLKKRSGRAMPAKANAGRSGRGPPRRREKVKLAAEETRTKVLCHLLCSLVAQGFSPVNFHQQRIGCRSRIERFAKPAEWKRARIRRRVGRNQQDRCRAANRNAESRRPARAPCIRAGSRRSGRPGSGSTTPGRRRRGTARASISGSSPERSTSASTRLPSLTMTTPSSKIFLAYPRLRIEGARPSRAACARSPPQAGSCRCRRRSDYRY